ncbi:MAG: hypothetical protein AAFZ65_09790 [Planctomycetota bacterium]
MKFLRNVLAKPQLLLALCSGALVMSIAVVNAERSSPGPLTRVHAGVDGLSATSGCADCHGGFFGDMNSSCLACHEPIALQLDEQGGLHGTIQAQNCAACHSEHHGPSFSIVNAASFARAGVPDREQFDHSTIGWEMDGKHLELSCSECHTNADVEVLPAGEFRFLGLSQDCSSCHEDVHEGAMRLDCNQCHVQTSFEQHVSVGHDEFLHLAGGHAPVTCRDCHAESTPHRLERIVKPKVEHALRGCVDCHDSPHAERFVAGAGKLLATPADASCIECHEAEHPDFRDAEATLSAELHATSGFALVEPHDDAQCAECHDPAAADFAGRHPGRTQDSCAACHDDPHGGQFATGPFARKGCVGCHERTHFEPHAFTVEKHDRARLALEGTHLDTDCNSCHEVPEPEAPRVFRGTPRTCAECHEDAHGGFFDPLTAELEWVKHGDCARCHQPTAFDETLPEAFDHGRWTGFAVTGAHEQSGCAACHEDAHAPDASGRVFGRVDDLFGEVHGPFTDPVAADQACATCHFDPHEGRFDAAELPTVYEDRAGCARCHGDNSFRAFPHGFDHGLWTGFPLDGQHAQASCADCHQPIRAERPGGRTWAPALGTNCGDCHVDVHVGQFADEVGRTDCRRCHEDTGAFHVLDFDHDWDSRFALHEAHEQVGCADCHQKTVIDGIETTRYRPLGRECTDCHGVRAGSLRKRTGR